jgi:hypothetical protein
MSSNNEKLYKWNFVCIEITCQQKGYIPEKRLEKKER